MKNIFEKFFLKLCIFLLFITTLLIIIPDVVHAQRMIGRLGVTPVSEDTTIAEEAKGKEVWGRLQNKTIKCIDLKDEDFDVLGEYFMGQRVGVAHAAMNTMMRQMMGEAGEIQMHVSLGKSQSGCDKNVQFPTNGLRFLPMMGINGSSGSWGGGRYPMMGDFGGWGMMGGWNNGNYGWNIFGSVNSLLIIIFLTLGIIYFWKQITRREKK
ncbi:MAG: hypothetical protein UT63_C0015G0009 [Candidatus Gottesmanbacteria bacterium GW2011_GWC2_39_8]|uniref:Uncharacterized protein n=1 Tax=Candidatus Gottesmanbacteria bacterium GW2011_GWC2_39_8 TaxID=1618450 RepID=A0A0G0Q038_9BACT|nr:MAG: hypothetical protein UT63_C0015G0009 [Candidatus Gottesmanbacteria bacterium GW2011_GWC2_39_8]